MTRAEFRASLAQDRPSAGLDVPLQALWWAGKNEWDKAHRLVMAASGADAAWVHAYLHSVEGDLPNARYWYAQAGHPAAGNALNDEWDAIVAAMLGG